MVDPPNDSARKRIVRCEVPALVSREAEYWQTATAEQRRAEETTAAKRFIATSLAKSVDKYGARIKELTTRDRDSPERPDFPEVLSAVGPVSGPVKRSRHHRSGHRSCQ